MLAGSIVIGLLAALSAMGPARASPITFAFTGAIDNDPFDAFDSATFTGSYTFDSTMAQVLSTPQSGGYAGSGGVFNMNVAFTGTLVPSVNGPYIADTLNITVNNNFPGPLDQYLVTGTSSTDSNLSIQIDLDDFTGTAFSNTHLPFTAPSLAGFTSVRFALFAGDVDNPIEAEGNLLTLQCTAGCITSVPEPDGLLLVCAALGAFGFTRRRVTVN